MSGSLNPTALLRLLGAWNSGVLPAYRELADVVRLLVMDGRIPLDVALPSERALAQTLGVSRTTVTAAYASLREQGSSPPGKAAADGHASRIAQRRSARRGLRFRTGCWTSPMHRCPPRVKLCTGHSRKH